jgi:hypothetical protein
MRSSALRRLAFLSGFPVSLVSTEGSSRASITGALRYTVQLETPGIRTATGPERLRYASSLETPEI